VKLALIIAIALVCVPPSVRAQQPQTPQQPQQEQQPKIPQSLGVDDSSARASKVIGAKVYRGDNAVGEIKDVLLDLNHATIPAVILSIGGLLGINEKQVAVPPAMIKVGKEARFTIDLTEDQLKAAPPFDPSKL
jgi:sporulation protein YlmC with PRC-barrel domain